MIQRLAIFVLLAASFASTAGEVIKGSDGTYWESHGALGGTMLYQADTINKSCSVGVSIGSLAKMPCKKLVLRAGWKKIITWEATPTDHINPNAN